MIHRPMLQVLLMNRILVVDGTGNVGRLVVSQLAARGARFRVMTRNPDSVRLPRDRQARGAIARMLDPIAHVGGPRNE